MEEIRNKELLDRIRSLLQRDKIRLWEAPYTDVTTGDENLPEDLVTSICAELGSNADEVRSILSYLRRHALEKLAAKQRADWIQLKIRSSVPTDNKASLITVSLSPTSTGQDLEKLLQDQLALHDQNLKMICSGRMIQLNESLQNQNIRNNLTVLVIAVPKTTVEATNNDIQRSNLIEAVKEAARILDDNAHHGSRSNEYRLRLTNQYGQELTAIPDEERRSLMVAMSLHEKGRSFLRKKDYLSALALFSEADNEFRQCSSQILNSVDNWGLLNLDIVWCYLNMRNVNDLQDASERLMKCDTCFVRVYGNSFERLKALQKDGTGHVVLFVRLHLLQAIVAYHAGRKTDAKNLLNLADEEARMMHVEPEKLTEIMLMGYTASEARRGLRSGQGNIDQAVEFIIEKRRTQEQLRLDEEAKEEEERLQRRYGRTQNGQKLNISHLKQLQSMGYPRRVCAEALKHANNHLEEASEMLLTNLDTLMAGIDDDEKPKLADTTAQVPELVALGADPDVAHALLTIHNGQLERAAEEFLQKFQNSQNTTTTTSDADLTTELLERAEKILNQVEEKNVKRIRREEDDAKRRAALQSIVPELLHNNNDDGSEENPQDTSESHDYLDLLLNEEEAFICEYRQRLVDDGYC